LEFFVTSGHWKIPFYKCTIPSYRKKLKIKEKNTCCYFLNEAFGNFCDVIAIVISKQNVAFIVFRNAVFSGKTCYINLSLV